MKDREVDVGGEVDVCDSLICEVVYAVIFLLVWF
jgi:hypothetical protein